VALRSIVDVKKPAQIWVLVARRFGSCSYTLTLVTVTSLSISTGTLAGGDNESEEVICDAGYDEVILPGLNRTAHNINDSNEEVTNCYRDGARDLDNSEGADRTRFEAATGTTS